MATKTRRKRFLLADDWAWIRQRCSIAGSCDSASRIKPDHPGQHGRTCDASCMVAPPSSASSPTARASMLANRAVDTGPEVALRRELHQRRLRFRKHRRPLPGVRCTADIVFPRARLAVFVDGCYWHRCPTHADIPGDERGVLESEVPAECGARPEERCRPRGGRLDRRSDLGARTRCQRRRCGRSGLRRAGGRLGANGGCRQTPTARLTRAGRAPSSARSGPAGAAGVAARSHPTMEVGSMAGGKKMPGA